ncbi:adenine phosphoribosyltransferase [Rhodocaloribacter litoris]|uniref:adenine phosphoribosyltransferase n=1 Tax=Rhodocaloribacter litoris TaxID=2558931 RepID=UPI0014244F5B|nr:adenine phosphoribosyltransferase [Rhodocaloribacter litoris]QXD16525.1 adenine phosphoribosyltransferase [Rhodocaloribacter litoris]
MNVPEALREAVRTIPDFPRPGIQFKDITPLLARPDLLREAVRLLAAPFEETGVTRVVAIEARGFILGSMLAQHLGAGFVPVRKAGKLPYRTVQETYALEYGTDTIEMHVDALGPGDRVLIHDDVIATGGTAAATTRLVQRAGAGVVGCAFLIELGFLEGRTRLDGNVPVHAVLRF